jgi:uncharacterized phage-like protein YoqJ
MSKRSKSIIKSQRLNYFRNAMRRVKIFLKAREIRVVGQGIKQRPLIRQFADIQGLEIPNNIKVKNWLIDLYLSGSCKDCCQTDPNDVSFYTTKAWKDLRLKVLKSYPKWCMKCGSTEHLHIDHIKPRSLYPELELSFDNLQILCRTCNCSKNNRNSKDYRNPNEMILSVTGHRPDKLGFEYDMKGPISKKIYLELDRLVDQLKPTKMITGMALGVDMLFANVAINRKIPFIAAIPCLNQESKWPEQSKRLYSRIINDPLCTVHYVTNEEYTSSCMQIRNKWMVDNSDLLVAVWDGTKGGTSNCINYAKKNDKSIRRIDPKSLF